MGLAASANGLSLPFATTRNALFFYQRCDDTPSTASSGLTIIREACILCRQRPTPSPPGAMTSFTVVYHPSGPGTHRVPIRTPSDAGEKIIELAGNCLVVRLSSAALGSDD